MRKVYLPLKILFVWLIVILSGCCEHEILKQFKSKDHHSYWWQLPGKATDIGVGADGSVYITGTTTISQTGGYSISKWTDNGWLEIPGAAIRIAVDTAGDPWVVNKSNLI